VSTAVRTRILERPAAREPRSRTAILALGRIESVRLARHPVFLAGAAMSAVLLVLVLPASDPGASYWGLVGWGFSPLAGATLLTANLATLRSTRHGTDALLGSLPVGDRSRTASVLLAVLVGGVVGAGLLAAAYVYLGARAGLEITWIGEKATPSARELAQGPAAVFAAGALGVALARWLPFVVVAPVVALAVLGLQMVVEGMSPVSALTNHHLTWFFPFANPSITPPWSFWPCYQSPANPCDVERFAVASAGWHLAYLGGFAVLFATLALLRDSAPRTLLVACAGPAVAVVVAAQVQLP
jgi:hypothetical protein